MENDSDSYTSKHCLQNIVKYGRSLLSEPLASLFEFSLTLRSASPRLVLYRQLAEDSLSSFPLSDETDSNFAIGDISEANGITGSKKADPLLVGMNPKSPGGKCCWVDTGGTLFFDVSELLLWLGTPTGLAGDSSDQPELFDFDHVHSESTIATPVAILYGALGTDCFREFHAALAEASKKFQGRVKYVVRPVLPSGCEARSSRCGAVGTRDALNLGGYGVELALKNMEYKAMDDSAIKKGVTLEDPRTEDLSQEVRGFIFSRILERKPELTTEIMAFRDYLLSSTISDTLDVWELKDLGHQTAQRIVHASDPLQSMQEINQNFPSVVSSLSRMKLNDSVKDEIMANQRMIPPGKSLMALNGALINIEDIDLYILVDMVHQELSLAHQFSKLKAFGHRGMEGDGACWALCQPISTIIADHVACQCKLDPGLSAEQIRWARLDQDRPGKCCTGPVPNGTCLKSHGASMACPTLQVTVEIPQSTVRKLLSTLPPSESSTFRVDFRSTYVHYLNNLEEDPMYKRWRSNINESIDMIISMYENNFPMRFGVILYSSKLIKEIEKQGGEFPQFSAGENDSLMGEDISSLIIRLFIYIEENHGTQMAFQFLSNVNRVRSSSEDSIEETLEVHHVEGAFVEALLSKAKSPPQDILLKLEKELMFKEKAEESSLFVFKLGLARLQCCLLMNGLVYESTEDALISSMNDELPKIQEQVYYGYINSHTDVLDKFLSENGCHRYNPQIIGEGKAQKRFISLSASILENESVLNDINYLHSPETIDDLKPVTHLLAVNVTSRKGTKLLHEGIRYLMGGSKRARIGVLFSADAGVGSPGLLFVKVFGFTASSFSHKQNVLVFLDQLCSFYESKYMLASSLGTESTSLFIEKVCELAMENGLPCESYKAALSEFSVDIMKNHLDKVAHFLYRQLGLEFYDGAVITNGRVMLPIDESTFLSDDLGLLESVEFEQRIKHIMEIIEDVKWQDIDPDIVTSKFISDLIMCVSSSMAIRKRSSDTARFEVLNGKYRRGYTMDNRYRSAALLMMEHRATTMCFYFIDGIPRMYWLKAMDYLPRMYWLKLMDHPEGRRRRGRQLIEEALYSFVPCKPSPPKRSTPMGLSTVFRSYALVVVVKRAVVLSNENSGIHIDAVVDPLSPSGQKLSPLLRVLWKCIQPSMRIVLNPLSSLVDLPLKNYYRYVVPTMDDFSSTDHSINGPKAFFPNMPLSKTLTMNLDVPEPWLVEPVIAVHDLDNILLENLGDTRTLQAVFELEALVLTGHCAEKDHDPPRGLQLILGTKSMPHLVDTLVMANLGYWQMKVSPGVWYLQLAPGRSSDLYILKENGDENQKLPLSKRIIINDLLGKPVHLEVVKKKGKEHEQLLASSIDDDHLVEKKKGNHNSWNTNLLKWASDLIGGNEQSKKSTNSLESSIQCQVSLLPTLDAKEHSMTTENTICLHEKKPKASIELTKKVKDDEIMFSTEISACLEVELSLKELIRYERFLKIMILSVLKNTHRPVKFWFIKNYLSPQFKDVIPHMAQEYSFDYELITYKWPTWLHKQKEKQRIIWAYKILFLDVIFPLSLEKVIFVDADQIIRTDMGELYDMDIKGRPLAYTPFCDNNKDMDGYRFWRQLLKFPFLFQDLPNYAQHTVPIFSLPQEWLWCESWCGNATKSKAKTIDLCNNPMTKEPKLQGARRIVSEWPDLDSEARRFTAIILGEEIDPQKAVEPPNIPDSSISNSLQEDRESKSEL
ncbi:hypothetical protein HHK36_004552 [Tetracentron sinense]|uniref:UDP-glucose:glycoprotein glucosyltransferase n=2 Tax=Magnoliopsida TaxID=3398 RepID=A0A835DQF4_TETSI|nr:hypothetical protein HHK36_004552 [Tetracentron sinense]